MNYWQNDIFVNLAIFFLLAFKYGLYLCLNSAYTGQSIRYTGLMKQDDTLPTQYRHIEYLHEEVWCQNINHWQTDSFVNLASFSCLL